MDKLRPDKPNRSNSRFERRITRRRKHHDECARRQTARQKAKETSSVCPTMPSQAPDDQVPSPLKQDILNLQQMCETGSLADSKENPDSSVSSDVPKLLAKQSLFTKKSVKSSVGSKSSSHQAPSSSTEECSVSAKERERVLQVQVMSEDAVRQTRSQKRALERESQLTDGKRLKLDGSRSVQDSSILKATIKVELQTGDEPMDMSNTAMKSEARSPSPEDVIVLSEETPSPQTNGRNHVKELDADLLMRSSPEERKRVVKQLKEELRLEEAKLILLKKLRQSHTHKDSGAQKSAAPVSSATPPLVKKSAVVKTTVPVISARASGTVIPPPLVRGAQLSKHSAQIIMPPLVRGAQSISVSPQQVSSLRQQQNSSSGPPPLLLAPRAVVSSVQGQKIIQPGLIRMATIPSTGLLLSISQAAGSNLKSGSVMSNAGQSAKLVLRKQLEKTLLEIPPPKPPAPQLTFLPSAANNEFIYLLGLEEVVQNLLESLGRGKQGLYAGLVVSAGEPCCCSQCQTDFTCRWRRDKGGAVMCEQCMSSNKKKVLKADHTNRLKAAFVKALQQEQELDKRVLQQATSSASSSSSSSSSAHGMRADQVKARPSSSAQTVSRSATAVKQVSQSALARSVQPSAIRVVPHAFSPSSQLQNAVAAAALVSRPGVTMAYVNPSLSVQKPSVVERHREYLLDMIPSRSVSQTANSWK